MKKVIEFVKGWRMPGEPWSMYLFVPLAAVIVLLGFIIFMIGPYPIMRLLGFSDEDIWSA